jgi:hypothetical protein
MNEDDTFNLLVETIYRHSFILEAMSIGIGHAMALVMSCKPKCEDDECENIMTWNSLDKAHNCCDRHRAILILEEKVKEEDWEEVEEAEHIRGIQNFMELKKKNDTLMTVH